MPTSQFKIYTAADPQGPGPIDGTTGSLIQILDYCLVGGYGTGSYYKAPAGWTKPLPNSASAGGDRPVYGCWAQGGGFSRSLFMNDGGPTQAFGREAWITGYESMSFLCNAVSGSNVGGGFGQFPTPGQSLTLGYVIVRKADATSPTGSRYWMVAADSTTMYMWIWPEAADLNRCYHWMFGDIYSMAGAGDVGRCSIYGRTTNNTALGQSNTTGVSYDFTDLITPGPWAAVFGNYFTTTGYPGHFLNRSGVNGVGIPLQYQRKGDPQFGQAQNVNYGISPYTTPHYGVMQTPNGADNQLWISPLEVIEPDTYPRRRGRFRGLYHPMSYYGTFQVGQPMSGSGEWAGKTFIALRYSYMGSVWLLETSNTVETN